MFSYVSIQLDKNMGVSLIVLSKDQMIDNFNCTSQTIITCSPRDHPPRADDELCFFPAHWCLAIRVDEKVLKLWTVIGVQGLKCGISFLRERVGFFSRETPVPGLWPLVETNTRDYSQ